MTQRPIFDTHICKMCRQEFEASGWSDFVSSEMQPELNVVEPSAFEKSDSPTPPQLNSISGFIIPSPFRDTSIHKSQRAEDSDKMLPSEEDLDLRCDESLSSETDDWTARSMSLPKLYFPGNLKPVTTFSENPHLGPLFRMRQTISRYTVPQI